jgi:hypothetical protein
MGPDNMDDQQVGARRCRKSTRFAQGASRSGSVYSHHNAPIRVLIETDHNNGAGRCRSELQAD